MPTESDHHRERKRGYTIVLLPESETGKQKSITASKLGFLSLGLSAFILVAAIVMGALVYTPLGVYIPIPNPELENRYHKQIVAIQEELAQLTTDLMWLREYNVRLRKALGENVPSGDSTLMAAQQRFQRTDRKRSTTGEQEVLEPPGQPSLRSEFQKPIPLLAGQSGITKVQQAEFPLTLPVTGYVTQEFKPEEQHFGIDFAGKEGSTIYAAADGNVIFAGWTYEDGYMIMIDHDNGYRTTYKHNQTLLRSVGEYVRRAEPIALLGNSGKLSYGPHLHFEVSKDGISLNPRDFLLTVQ